MGFMTNFYMNVKRGFSIFMVMVICFSTVAVWRIWGDDGHYPYYSTYFESAHYSGDYFSYPYYVDYDGYFMEQEYWYYWRYYAHNSYDDDFTIAHDSGIPEDAVRIRTAGELMAISRVAQSAGRYYVLENDIHLTHEWSPIDDFRGVFDGQGFTIHNLYVLERSARPNAGLFGSTLYATIRNVCIHLGFQGVTGLYRVGGLIGYARNTNIEQSSVLGNVSVISDHFYSVGGLVGMFQSFTTGGPLYYSIFDSFYIGNISALSRYTMPNALGTFASGGLIGRFHSGGRPQRG